MNLSDLELDYYARHIVLPQVGGVGQKALNAARVAMVGAGGIGSAALPALSGAGVGHITIIDCDTIGTSNLHRQPLFESRDVGKSKAGVAASFAKARNPHIVVQSVEAKVAGGNARDLFAGHDLVVDGSDNFATRLAVSDACVVLGIPLISAAAIQFQAQVGLWRGRPCYRCFVGDAFDAEDCDTCADVGVMGALTGTAGNFAAMLAINFLVGIGPDQSGKVHIFDGEKLVWRTMTIPPDQSCPTCSA